MHESKWTPRNKCSAKGSPFRSEEPTTNGVIRKEGGWSIADTCGEEGFLQGSTSLLFQYVLRTLSMGDA